MAKQRPKAELALRGRLDMCDVRVRRAAFAFVVTCPPKGSEPSHAESTDVALVGPTTPWPCPNRVARSNWAHRRREEAM